MRMKALSAWCGIAALLCIGSAQSEGHLGGNTAEDTASVVFSFHGLGRGYELLAQRGSAQRLRQLSFVRRWRLLEKIENLRREIRRLSASLKVDLSGVLLATLNGSGELCYYGQPGRDEFVLDIRPAAPVRYGSVVKRLVKQDPAVALLRTERVGPVDLQVLEIHGTEITVAATKRRIVASSSSALVRKRVRHGPGGAAAETGRPEPYLALRINAARLWGAEAACDLITLKLTLTEEGFRVTGALGGLRPFFCAAFQAAPPGRFRLPATVPQEPLCSCGLRADLRSLYTVVRESMPPSQRRLFDRRVEGLSHSLLGGTPLATVLAGLGPEVLAFVAPREGGVPIPASFSLLCEVRTEQARKALRRLGRSLYGISLLQGLPVRPPRGENLFFSRLNRVDLALAVGPRRVCLSTSPGVASCALSEAPKAVAVGPKGAPQPAGHFLFTINTARFSQWLGRHRTQFLAQGRDAAPRELGLRTAQELAGFFRHVVLTGSLHSDRTLRFVLECAEAAK